MDENDYVTYDATDPLSVDQLCTRIESLNGKQLRWFLAATVNSGLMFFNMREITPEMLMLMSEDVVIGMFNLFSGPEIEDFLVDLADHVYHGEDLTPDSDAIGGWNQQEIILATGMLTYAETI